MTDQFSSIPLRELHLPEPISWWPPALGWWLLALLIPALILAFWHFWRSYRRGRIRRAALRSLGEIEAAYAIDPDCNRTAAALSTLLRRISITLHPRPEVAGLTGRQWLEFLDSPLRDSVDAGGFTRGAGRILLEAPYSPLPHQCEMGALFKLARNWILATVQGTLKNL